jgi:hypothetical protein
LNAGWWLQSGEPETTPFAISTKARLAADIITKLPRMETQTRLKRGFYEEITSSSQNLG